MTSINKNKVVRGVLKVGIMSSSNCEEITSTTTALSTIEDGKITDLSGNWNDATVVGATYNTADESLTFNGSNNYANSGLKSYDLGNSITFVARVRVNVIKSSYIIGNWEGAGGELGMSSDVSCVGYFCMYLMNTAADGIFTQGYHIIKDPNHITIGVWNTVVGTYDGSELSLYVNGVKVVSEPMTGNIRVSSVPIAIAANPNGETFGSFAAMDIKEVLVFDRGLSESEIVSNYANEINVTNNSNLLLYYKF